MDFNQTRARWLLALLLAIAFGLSAWLSTALTRELERVAAIWLSNGLLVGALLIVARGRALIAAACFIANAGVNLLIGDPPLIALSLGAANSIEVAIAMRAVHGVLGNASDFLKPRLLWRFVCYAVVLAPLASSTLGAMILNALRGADFKQVLISWYRADALGMAVMVPLILALRPGDIRQTLRSARPLADVLSFALLIGVALTVFSQNNYPLLFLLFPPLLLVTFRLGFVGTAGGVFIVGVIALTFTLQGQGPLTLIRAGSLAPQVIALQGLVATLIITTYPVCAVIVGQRRLLSDIAASEERFRVIADNSSDIVALTDVAGTWRYISPAVTTAFGWTVDELTGRTGMDFVHPEDADIYARGSKRLSTGRDTLTGVFRMRHRDGHYVWVETISRLLRDPVTGRPTGWVSNTRDISARRRIETMKDEFVSTVNHELRTPLTAMVGAIGLAVSGRFGTVSPQINRLLAIVKSNGDRLAVLVNDILDFEKVSSGKMRFNLQPHQLNPLLEQCVIANRPYADQHGVTLQLLECESDCLVTVDSERFQQVMANLLSNAAKFSPRGSGVEVSASTPDAGHCRISIIDHGVGIPVAFRDVMFERFAQADGSDNRAKGGTGLGMAIAKHMTEHMHGRISFESEENVGTTFHLDFPQAQAPQNAAG